MEFREGPGNRFRADGPQLFHNRDWGRVARDPGTIFQGEKADHISGQLTDPFVAEFKPIEAGIDAPTTSLALFLRNLAAHLACTLRRIRDKSM